MVTMANNLESDGKLLATSAELVDLDDHGRSDVPLKRYPIKSRFVFGSDQSADVCLSTKTVPSPLSNTMCVILEYLNTSPVSNPGVDQQFFYRLVKMSEEFDIRVNGEEVLTDDVGRVLHEHDLITVNSNARFQLRYLRKPILSFGDPTISHHVSINEPLYVPRESKFNSFDLMPLSFLNSTHESGLLEVEVERATSKPQLPVESLHQSKSTESSVDRIESDTPFQPRSDSVEKVLNAPPRKVLVSACPVDNDESVSESTPITINQLLLSSSRKMSKSMIEAVEEARRTCNDPIEKRVLNTPSGILRFANQVEEIASMCDVR
ncbi:hypothetical protein ACOME3_010562 [Neoechinorhynchus agilis]